MSSVSQLAVYALKTYLEGTVSAAVTTYNNARRPELLSKPGPFVIPSSGDYTLGTTLFDPAEIGDWAYDSLEVGWVFWFAIAAGSYTADQLVAAQTVNQLVDYPVLDATTDGRIRMRYYAGGISPLRLVDRYPSDFTPASTVVLNSILGWDPGGEIAVSPPLVAPTARSICDGFPAIVPDMHAGMWLIIGDRQASPVGDSSLRRDVWEVRLPLHVMLPVRADAMHRSREAISGAVGMLEGLLLSTSGRYLGRQSNGDVIGVEVLSERIDAQPIALEELPHAYFDVATIDLLIRIHQRH